uniref:Uncharacterized protein n=1 Tax=Cacopsylla melanoneura TaxID=428564 RepID=A0A8D9EEU5_9HEMI
MKMTVQHVHGCELKRKLSGQWRLWTRWMGTRRRRNVRVYLHLQYIGEGEAGGRSSIIALFNLVRRKFTPKIYLFLLIGSIILYSFQWCELWVRLLDTGCFRNSLGSNLSIPSRNTIVCFI